MEYNRLDHRRTWTYIYNIRTFKVFEPNLYEPSLYSAPYNIPQRVVGIFLIYCFLSVIYWIIKKKINMVVHYSLIITIYIAITVLYVIAVQSGI